MTALKLPNDDRSALNPIELSEFKRLEKIANNTYDAGMKFISCMKEIFDKRLYREGWATWASYLEERWQISPREFNHQVTLQALAGPDPDAKAILPTETLSRPLHQLPPELKVQAWERAKEIAGEGVRPDSKQVYQAAREVAPEIVKPARTQKPKTIDDVDKAKDAGIVPQSAVVEIVTHYADDSQGVCETPLKTEDDLTDDEWLDREEMIEASDKLDGEVLVRFRAEALAYRHVCQARREYIAKVKPIFDRLKREHGGYIGPWMQTYYAHVGAHDPTRWHACDECAGGGQKTLIGNCDKCRGRGFLIKD